GGGAGGGGGGGGGAGGRGRRRGVVGGGRDGMLMRCWEKPPPRRYDTANGLARDLQRHLADELVEARPPSAGYRLRKLVRRNKGPMIAASMVLLALVAGIIGTSWGLMRAQPGRGAGGRRGGGGGPAAPERQPA